MKIDQDVIEAKLDIIERNLVFLDEFKGIEYEDFASSYKNVVIDIEEELSDGHPCVLHLCTKPSCLNSFCAENLHFHI